MNELTIARAIHILSIVIWMGGVAFVTIVLIPTIRYSSFRGDECYLFNTIENRFAQIARALVLLAGCSGFYMVYQLDAWNRFWELRYFWMHAMVLIWLMFVLALFLIEPYFIKDHGRVVKDGRSFGSLQKTQVVHLLILTLSLITIFISVLGAHGFFG
jgi:uncharacterized membrane protein